MSRRLGFCGRHSERGFCAADILKSVVRAHRNGVLLRGKSAERDFVAFFRSIADVAGGGYKGPIATIKGVLGALGVAGRVARPELSPFSLHLRQRSVARLRCNCFEMLD